MEFLPTTDISQLKKIIGEYESKMSELTSKMYSLKDRAKQRALKIGEAKNILPSYKFFDIEDIIFTENAGIDNNMIVVVINTGNVWKDNGIFEIFLTWEEFVMSEEEFDTHYKITKQETKDRIDNKKSTRQ